jgi:hypothetical protein
MAVNTTGTTQRLTTLLDGALDLAVAFRDEGAQGVASELFRAEIDDKLRDAARDWLKNALRAYRVDEPLASDPDRPLRSGEWYGATPQSLGLSSLTEELRQPQNLPVLQLKDLTERDPTWYAFVARAPAGDWAAFTRRSSRFIVARRHGRVAFFREQTVSLVSPESKALYFDERFDLVLQEKIVLVADTNSLDTLFTDRATMEALVPKHVSQLVAQGLVLSNPDEWTAACQRNLYMMKKLARISESGYVAQINPKKVMKLLKDFGVTGKVINSGKFVFDKSDRWLLLKVLDEDFLNSPLTANRYESSAKVRVTKSA